MKKNKPFQELFSCSLKKTFKIMRNALILLFVGVLQVHAIDTYSQKTRLSLNFTDTQLTKVFDKIEEASDFYFLYNEKLLDVNRKVSITENDQLISVILDDLFKGTDVKYTIIDRKIILAPDYLTKVLFPQQIKISGRITDSDIKPMTGVNVAEKGTINGTISDIEGKFSIIVASANSILVFSSIGYITQEITVGSQTAINVSLAENAIDLEEVVVVGYGTQKKRDLTGAISSIKAENLLKVSTNSFTSAIQGIVPGVFITQTTGAPGGSSSVRIRGVGTTGGNEPLYVIDGFPLGGESMSIGRSTDNINGLSIINPNDIESIEILKDASAAAIYGSRAANGVIIITTKRGKTGRAQTNLKISTGFQQLWRSPKFLNAEEFATMANELYNNSGMTPNPEWADPASFGKGTNWIDQVFRNAPMQNYDFSTRGGTEKLKTAVSLSYIDQQGTLIETDYKRYTGRFSADLEANDKLKFGGSLAFTYTQAKGQQNQSLNLGIFNLAQQFYPTLSPDENVTGSSAYYTTQADNPVLRAKSMDNQLRNSRVFGNFFGEYEIISNLKFKTNLGLDGTNNRNSSWEPKVDRGYYRNLQAYLGETLSQGLTWLIENTLSYSREFGKHKFSTVIGQTAQKSNSNWISATGISFLNEQLRVINGSQVNLRQAGGSNSNYVLASYLGRINYAYKDKYLISASIRRDGSSNFGPNNKWGSFPAVSLGWNISEEGFLINNKFIDQLKIRGSWGQLGNDAIGAYGYLSTIRVGTTGDNYVLGSNSDIIIGVDMLRPGNPDLKWETSEQIDIGIDASFLKGKLYLTSDYYIKNTKDMLINLPVSVEAGFRTAPSINAGKVQNKGLEFLLGYRNNFGDLNFDISGNITTLKNEVKSLGVGTPITGPSVSFTGLGSYTEVGQPIGYFRGYIVDGIYQTNEEVNTSLQPNAVAGDFKFRDINGDNQLTDADKVKLGKPWPDIMYGMNLTLKYKGFDLDMMLQGVAGNEILNACKYGTYPMKYFSGAGVVNASVNILDRWTPGSGRNEIPQLKYVDANGNYANSSSFYVEKGDYMRIRNIVLGYNIPFNIINKMKVFQNIKVYVSVQNLYTITRYSGFDPEIGSTNPLQEGIDNGIYPVPRTFMAGINVSF
jgi:TonB-linked SusC/RagA family outer membrane protein